MCSMTSPPPAEPQPAGHDRDVHRDRRSAARRLPPGEALARLAVNARLQELRGKARGSKGQEINGSAQLKALARVADNVLGVIPANVFRREVREVVDRHLPDDYDLSATWPTNAPTPAWLIDAGYDLSLALPVFEVQL